MPNNGSRPKRHAPRSASLTRHQKNVLSWGSFVYIGFLTTAATARIYGKTDWLNAGFILPLLLAILTLPLYLIRYYGAALSYEQERSLPASALDAAIVIMGAAVAAAISYESVFVLLYSVLLILSVGKKTHILYRAESKRDQERITHERDMIAFESVLAVYAIFSFLLNATNAGEWLGFQSSADILPATVILLLGYVVAMLLAKLKREWKHLEASLREA